MTSAILIAVVGFIYFAVAVDQFCIQHNFWNGVIWFGYAIAQTGLWNLPFAHEFMTKFNIMTPEIAEIDKTITLLKTRREKLVAKEANKKAQELCAEIRKRKGK